MSEERKFELRNENYFVVSGWMINDLKLGGNELTTYAIIYSFSQDRRGWCYASREYIAEWLGSSIKTVQRCIDSLISQDLVVKEINTSVEGRFNVYKAFRTSDECKAFKSERGQDNLSPPSNRGSGQSVRGVGTICPGGQDNLSSDTIYDNKDNNKDNNKEGANAPAPQKTSRFSKPSISEIAAYCSEKNISIDPASFYYFYESKGWKVGNTQMKNWKAAIQTWVKRSRNGYGSSYSVNPNSCGHNNPEGFDEL